jgi:hypothetical protein
MAMMDVRPVGVYVGQGFMGMAVIVGAFGLLFSMGMPVMFVVEMGMAMEEPVMGMEMSMSLLTKEEDPPKHEYGRKPEGGRGPFSEKRDGE